MHKFTDNAGNDWAIVLNGWQLKNLKQAIEFDARDPDSIIEAANDPALLCDVLFVLCEEQAKAKNVSDRQFGEAMTGDAIEAAAEAYLQESVDFFPQRQRPALRSVLAKMNETQDRAAKLAENKLNGPAMTELIAVSTQQADLIVDEMIAKTKKDIETRRSELLAGMNTGNSSGKLPA